MSNGEQALSELAAMRSDIAVAADAILFAAETGLSLLAGADRAMDTAPYSELFVAIVAACAFQDITGQRLTKIEALIASADFPASVRQPSFLEGPALHAQGLNQQSADSIFDDAPAGAAGRHDGQ